MSIVHIASKIGNHDQAAVLPSVALAQVPAQCGWLARLKPELRIETLAVLLAVAAAWQIASHFFPPFLFPPLQKIGATLVKLLSDSAALGAIGLTYVRIVVSLVVAFVLATSLGVVAGLNPRVERFLVPLIQLKQGVPGVCWAIFAILWFREMESRIAFVVIISTLPSFFYQARDGVHGIPHELWQMVKALRPTRWQMLRKLILPALVPAMLIGWRINLGNGTRITITAELLAGISGIGYQLRTAQEQFRMDSAIAWTVVLVAFVLVTDYGASRLERHLLRWRQSPEQAS